MASWAVANFLGQPAFHRDFAAAKGIQALVKAALIKDGGVGGGPRRESGVDDEEEAKCKVLESVINLAAFEGAS